MKSQSVSLIRSDHHFKIGPFLLRLFTRILVIACVLTVLFPLVWYFYNSFKSSGDYLKSRWAWPLIWHPENYKNAIESSVLRDWNGNEVGLMKLLANTLFTSILGSALLLLFSSSTAFILCKYRFPGRQFFKTFYLIAMVIPSILLIVPLYTQLNSISSWFKNNLIVVGVIYAIQSLPVNVFLLTRFVDPIDDALLEAARLDGANEFGIFFRVIVPTIKPMLIFIGLTSFMANFNEYTVALLFLQDPATYTLSLGLQQMQVQGATYGEYGMVFAGFTMTTSIMIILYLIFQKQILEGADMDSAVK